MFGIGMPEMLLIIAVALVVIGPKKLPDLAKSLGRAMGEFKKATSEIKQSIGSDTDFKEVKDTFDDIQKDIKGSVTFDNIDEYQPKTRPSMESANTPSTEHPASDTVDSEEAIGDLKQAFDDLNQTDVEPPDKQSSETDESESHPDATKEEPPSNDRG
jgi:sec-independent protein translocase protein TatB